MSEIRMVRQIVLKNPRELIPYENNARINDHVVPALVASIKRFGFNEPVVIDKSNVLVCGHTRIKAALELRMKEVPCVYVEGLTQEEIDAYRLADNKIAEQALWDYDKLKVELDKIGDDIKMSVFGFENGGAPNVCQFTEPTNGSEPKFGGLPPELSGRNLEPEPLKHKGEEAESGSRIIIVFDENRRAELAEALGICEEDIPKDRVIYTIDYIIDAINSNE